MEINPDQIVPKVATKDVGIDNNDNNEARDNNANLSSKQTRNTSGITKRKNWKLHRRLQVRWEQMFARLLKFKDIHGHCRVPNRYEGDPGLGAWVSTQRRQYKILTSGGSETTPMTPERASQLQSIGFVWETRDPRHIPWESRFEQLCEYKEKYGDCAVPVGFRENIQLSHWVSTQRQEYKNLLDGRASRLTKKRIQLLKGIGFMWEAQRGGPRWKPLEEEEEEEEEGPPARIQVKPVKRTKTVERQPKNPNSPFPFDSRLGLMRNNTPPAIPSPFLIANLGAQQDLPESPSLATRVGRKAAAILMAEAFSTQPVLHNEPPMQFQQTAKHEKSSSAQKKQSKNITNDVSVSVHPSVPFDDASWLRNVVSTANEKIRKPTIPEAFLSQSNITQEPSIPNAFLHQPKAMMSSGSSIANTAAKAYPPLNAKIQANVSKSSIRPDSPGFLDRKTATITKVSEKVLDLSTSESLNTSLAGLEDSFTTAKQRDQPVQDNIGSQLYRSVLQQSVRCNASDPESMIEKNVRREELGEVVDFSKGADSLNTNGAIIPPLAGVHEVSNNKNNDNKNSSNNNKNNNNNNNNNTVPSPTESASSSGTSKGGIFDDAEEDTEIDLFASAYLGKGNKGASAFST